MIIFFAVFFTLYGLLNFYVFLHGWQALPDHALIRAVYLALEVFLGVSFIAGRFLERSWYSPLSSFMIWVGSFWFAALLYFFLFVVALDLVRLLNHLIPFIPSVIRDHYLLVKQGLLGVTLFLVLAILAFGHWNALHPRTKVIELPIRKSVGGNGTFTIAMASDIHLGTIIGSHRLDAIVDVLNGMEADVILLPGDIVDEDLGPVVRANLGEHLRLLHARYGVFAVTGNHEYIGGVEPAVKYLRDHGIYVLRDSSVVLPCGVTIVGREDRSAGKRRATLASLLNGVDHSRPIIVMDHQPFHLEEAEHGRVDLQISGHTHHGQLWPLNYITNALYEMSWGYLRKGETHFYVSSGLGTWGPPVRTGNRPEVVRIVLKEEGDTR